MNQRENLLSLLRRQGYEYAPYEFALTPSLVDEYKRQTGSSLDYHDYFNMPWRHVWGLDVKPVERSVYEHYYDFILKEGTKIDKWGVAREPGSEAAKHMTHMRHPLMNIHSVEEMEQYPFPQYILESAARKVDQVKEIHGKGLAAVGSMHCTIWESAWYLRSMEELMMDMMSEDECADYLLDRVTELAVVQAETFAASDTDILFLGDDIGMQRTPMMSIELYCKYLKPRLKKVIDSARAIKPDIIVFYHSCGFVTPFIEHLIEAGVNVLNPLQSECMDFKEIHDLYGDKLSFHGTIGTQTVMPFGTPEQVRSEVFKNLDIAGKNGGLLVAPTHVLEPEIPWENILAYVDACKDYKL